MRHLVLIDTLVAAAITLLTVCSTLGAAVGRSTWMTVLVWLMALMVSLPLAFRRRWPIPAFGVVLASALVALLLGMPGTPTVLAVAVALYSAALSVQPWRSAVALGAALLGVTLVTVLRAIRSEERRVGEEGR